MLMALMLVNRAENEACIYFKGHLYCDGDRAWYQDFDGHNEIPMTHSQGMELVAACRDHLPPSPSPAPFQRLRCRARMDDVSVGKLIGRCLQALGHARG